MKLHLLIAALVVVLAGCNSDPKSPAVTATNRGPEMPTPLPPPRQPEPDRQRHIEVVPLTSDGFPQFVVRQAGSTIVFSQIERGKTFLFRIRENGVFLTDLVCGVSNGAGIPTDRVSLFMPQDPDFTQIQTFCASSHGKIWIEGTPKSGFSSGVAMPQGPTGTTRWEPVSGRLSPTGEMLLAVQADGSPEAGPRVGFTIGRYRTDGTQDLGFRARGVVVVGKPAISGSDIPRTLLVDPTDGSFYATVNSLHGEGLRSDDDIESYVVKFKKDGKIEKHFGRAGKVQVDDNAYRVIIRSAFLDSSRRIVLAYDRCTSANACETVLRRMDQYGGWDGDFGPHGRIDITRSRAQGETRLRVLSGPGDSVIYLEDHDVGALAQNSVYIGRYTKDGKLDASFSAGLRTLQAPSAPDAKCGLSDAVSDTQGRLLLLGYCGSSHVSFSRLLPNGQPDQAFGVHGVAQDDVEVGEFYSITYGDGPSRCELANPHGGTIALLTDSLVIASPVASDPLPDPIGVGCNSAALGVGFYFFDGNGHLESQFTPPGYLRTWHEVPFDPARVAIVTQTDAHTLLAVLGLGGDSYRVVGDPRPTTYFVKAPIQ